MISNPIAVGSGGGEGLHYLKVRSIANASLFPEFFYKTPSGETEGILDGKPLEEAADCQDGSVYILGVHGGSGETWLPGTHFVVSMDLEEDTLVLTATTVIYGGGGAAKPVEPN